MVGGAAGLGATAIVLWAMTRADAAVAAARTSVLFALIGAQWLREGFGPRLAGRRASCGPRVKL
jgi:hypothetical protein